SSRFYSTWPCKTKAPAAWRGLNSRVCPANKLALHRRGLSFGLRFGFRSILGVLAAEALHASGGIHQLLLAGKERMAGGADFNADVAFMSRPGNKGIAARAMHTNFVISGMNGCFHRIQTSIRILRFYRNAPGFSNPETPAFGFRRPASGQDRHS